MANSPFKKGTGRLALDRFDFQKHIEGNDFRHNATQVDVQNPASVYGSPNTVEQALSNISLFIDAQSGVGQGFIAVGDGYDTWHNADGSINFDPEIPALNLLLNPIFDAIYNGGTLPEAYERIRKGGIVLIKSGTYIVNETIEVPPGITLMGEGYGTKICNVTSLDIPETAGVAPTPKDTPTPAPVFRILPDLNRVVNDGAVDPNTFMFSKATRFSNMVICDNFVENTILGDVYYKLPQNSTGDNPIIEQQSGSNLELYNVYLLGRATFNSGTEVNAATRFGIQLDVSTGVTTGTFLKINNCFMDGFSIPIQFHSIGGVYDYLEISSSYIRSHGYLDGFDEDDSSNCIVRMNDNNARIINNDFYGNHSSFGPILYINNALGGVTDTNDRSKIILSDNNLVIDRGTNSDLPSTFKPYVISGAIASTFSNNAYLLSINNNYRSGFQISTSWGTGSGSPINGFNIGTNSISMRTTDLYLDVTSMQMTGGFYINAVTVGGTPYTLQSTDYVLLVQTDSAKTITLTSGVYGRMVVIKDISGNASTNNITITPPGGARIEGVLGDYIMNADYQVIRLVSDGTDWWAI